MNAAPRPAEPITIVEERLRASGARSPES